MNDVIEEVGAETFDEDRVLRLSQSIIDTFNQHKLFLGEAEGVCARVWLSILMSACDGDAARASDMLLESAQEIHELNTPKAGPTTSKAVH